MDDTFVLSAAFFDSFNPPFSGNGRGEDYKPKLASPRQTCRECGEPLIEIRGFSAGVILGCNNATRPCRLFHQRQGFIPNESYKPQQGQFYHLRHDVGIPSRKETQGTT